MDTNSSTETIKQLADARQGALVAIAEMEKASKADKADRSTSIGGLKRDIASYDRQIAELSKSEPPQKP